MFKIKTHMSENKNQNQGQKTNPNYVKHDLRRVLLVILIIVALLIVVKIIDLKTSFLLNLTSHIVIKK